MATSTPHILARTLKEAHDFAKSRGFERGRYRVINSSGTLKSVRNVDLFLVPGWERRYDRFQMKSAIRWTRMNIIDVAKLEEPAPVVDPFGNIPNFEIVPEVTGDPVGDDEIQDFFDLPVGEPDPVVETELEAIQDDLQPPGEQVAIRLSEGEVPPNIDPALAEALNQPSEPEKKPGRRRSRCKDCGDLHYKGDPCTPSESV